MKTSVYTRVSFNLAVVMRKFPYFVAPFSMVSLFLRRSLTLAFLLLCVSAILVGCDADKEGHSAKTVELYQNEFSSEDPLVALSAVNLYDRLICPTNQRDGSGESLAQKAGVNTDKLIDLQKKMLTSKSEWKRLQALQSLIVCKAEGLNAIVIERFRLETDPDVKQHLVEIVAMYGNLPLQREIASRTMRSRDLATQRTAYNLILEPYYESQLKISDPVRRDAVIERLASGVDLANPLISSKNLRNLLALNSTKQSSELIDLIENHDATLERRLSALTTLALAGDPGAAQLFKEIIALGGFENGSGGGRKRRARSVIPNARAVQIAKLGQIASGDRPVSQVDSLLSSRDKNTPYYLVEALLTNGSPEALDKIIKYYIEAPPEVQHYIVSAIYADNEWSREQLATLLDYVNDTDRLLLDNYLIRKGNNFRNETIAEALKKGTKEQIPRVLRFIRFKMDSPADIERFESLAGALQDVEKNETLSSESREDARFILFLLKLVKEKKLPDQSKIDEMSFDNKFQTLLIGAQLGLLSNQELELLQKSDNSFLRLVGSTYLRSK